MIVEPLVQGAAGMLRPPARLPARASRALRPLRGAADLRRGGDRLRPHRDDVRLRAGGGRARPALPRQGADRRLPAARGDAGDRADLRRLPRRARGGAHLLPRPHLHRQPARLRRRARQPRGLRAGANDGAPAAQDRAARRAAGARSPRCPRWPRCAAAASWSASTSASTTRPCASATRSPSRPASAARSSARSATSIVLMPPLSISEADLRRLVEINGRLDPVSRARPLTRRSYKRRRLAEWASGDEGPAEAPNLGEPAVPRPSASVVLLRRGGKHQDRALEVLLLKRTEEARFMPGVWVFPGGGVDPADGEGEAGHRACAVRELAEEAGIELPPTRSWCCSRAGSRPR